MGQAFSSAAPLHAAADFGPTLLKPLLSSWELSYIILCQVEGQLETEDQGQW